MDFQSIEYVHMLSIKRNFTLAAEELFISQPSLSQHIAKIEAELGTKLFARTTRNLTLTKAGEIFLEEGLKILERYEYLKTAMYETELGDASPVRFGISTFYSHYYLPKVLPLLLKKQPLVRFDITEDISYALEQKLLAGELDFCAVPLYPANENLEYEIIFKEEILIGVPQNHYLNACLEVPGCEMPFIDLSLLKDEPFILLKDIQKFSKMASNFCKKAGFEPDVVFETLNWETVNMSIAAGLGVGFVPRILTESIADLSLRPRYYRLPSNATRPYAIAKRKHEDLSNSAKAVIGYFKESFAHESLFY